MTWEIINTVGRLMLTVAIVIKVTRFGATMNAVERAGLGLMGGGSLMTVDVIWKHAASPFSDWSVTLITYGALIYLAGRTWRDYGHEWRNREQVRLWEEHKAQRGKP